MDIKEPTATDAEIILPLKLDAHTYARFRAFCHQIGKDPVDCGSELFRDLLSDDEFDQAPSKAFH